MSLTYRDNKEKLFKYRINSLYIGDSLVCNESGWRLDCLYDDMAPSEIMYVLRKHDTEIMRRKRADNMLKHMLDINLPNTMELQRGGCIDLLMHSTLLGYNAPTEYLPDALLQYSYIVEDNIVIQFPLNVIAYMYKKVAMICSAFKMLLQNDQSYWMITQQ